MPSEGSMRCVVVGGVRRAGGSWSSLVVMRVCGYVGMVMWLCGYVDMRDVGGEAGSATRRGAVLCRAVPCCAVPCRAVPCRAVPCRAVPCRAVLCCAFVRVRMSSMSSIYSHDCAHVHLCHTRDAEVGRDGPCG